MQAMKIDILKTKNMINKHLDFLRDTYNIKNIGIFGSVATGQNIETSDVDMLVEFTKPIGFFKFIELEDFLSKGIGKKVDLGTKNALKPAIKEEILQEVIYV